MLPFTKRPGRDESGDEDVVTKDDIVKPSAAPERADRTAASSGGRGKLSSMHDEDMTTLMPSKTIGDALATAVAARAATPRPAAGAPPTSGQSTPSSRPGPGSVPPPAVASRPGKFASQDADDDDGRTIVRGASSAGPKIVKRSASTSPPNSARAAKMGGNTLPTTISPAAVIKATLESARAGVKPRTDHLMAGPPQDLLEDLADIGKVRQGADVGAEHTAILKAPHSNPPPPMIQGVKALSTQAMQPQPLPQGTIPPGSSRSLTGPPPPNQSGGYAAQSGGYAAQYNGPVPSGSVSVPGVAMPQSMPAHFMVPHAPYSDGRVDPPGTAVTSRMKVAGRPAMSWALALAAFGIFVGVGAVAVMNGNDSFKETSASFVDPSRAAGSPGARAAAAPGQPATTAVPTGVPVANEPPTTVGVPPVAVPAAAPAVADTVTAPSVAAAAPPAAAPAPPPFAVAAAPAAAAAAAKPTAVAAAAPPRPAPAPVAAAPRPAPKPAPAAAADDAPVAAAPAAKPGGKGGKGAAKGGEMDDETKKALDELQKAQLERSF